MKQRPCKNLSASERRAESTETLHFVASFDKKRGRYAFDCSTQPMATIWATCDNPLARCPACGAENPVSIEEGKMTTSPVTSIWRGKSE